MSRLLLLLLDVAWPEPEDALEPGLIARDGIGEDGATDAAIDALNVWWLEAYGAVDSRRQRQ
jgi:hypothetical protein